MQHSQKAIDLVREFEGCRLSSYRDEGGVLTIGYGHTRGVSEGDTCTQEQADAWLAQDLNLAASDVSRLVHVVVSQNEFDALVDFVFNLGCGALAGSTLLKLLNNGQTLPAAWEFAKWDHAGGRVIEGLLDRRLAERDLFLEGM